MFVNHPEKRRGTAEVGEPVVNFAFLVVFAADEFTSVFWNFWLCMGENLQTID